MQNKITDIKQQQKNQERFSVYVNGQYAFSLDGVDLLKESLSVGQILSESDIERIMMRSESSKCLQTALSLAQSRMYTERDLRKKLSSKGFSEDSVDFSISELKRYNYVNDALFAQMYVSEVKQKYGPLKIKQKLFEKGISSEIIAEALQDVENTDSAVDVLRTKMRNQPISDEDYQKALRFLAQRGFNYEQAKKTIDTYMEAFYE